jgi:transcriptional regulator with XRE-family HTH domain
MPSDVMSLGPTIRAWRDRLSPTEVGLRVHGTRRAAGLRREELAQLTAISVDYVIQLEQGRADRPSANVAAALARALQLTDAERDHLYRLAHLVPPQCGEISDDIPAGVHRVLSRLGDFAVGVFAADWKQIWWNRGWIALVGDPSATPERLRNFACDTFPITNSVAGSGMCRATTTLGRENLEAAVVADLRRASGRFPDSTRMTDLIAHLAAGNQRFAHLWASGTVGSHREDQKIINHPDVGPLTVDCDVLNDDEAERKIIILTTAPQTEDDERYRQALCEMSS